MNEKQDGELLNWQEKLKKIGPAKLAAVVGTGLLLLILSCGDFFDGGSKSVEDEKTVVEENEQDVTQEAYKEKMEKQVMELLQKVEGVGKAEVMITLSASKEKVALKDNETATGKQQEETVLVEDDDNNSAPYVVQEKEPVPEGILVVCEGGGDVTLSAEIISAIQVLFDVEAHKIKVMKMEPH